MDEIRQILKEVEEMHPYRIPSIRESYDTYAEGWTDAVNEIESRLPVVPDTNVGNMSEFPNSSTLQPTCNQLATDCINRQAAVELAMKYCPDDDGAVQCDGDIRGLLDELENLPLAQPEQKWIPCSERLPKGEDNYLVQDMSYPPHIFVCRRIDSYWLVKTPVIAWMPLPEPYRPEGEEHG